MTLVRKPAFDAVLKLPGVPKDLWSDSGNILAFDNLLDAFGAQRGYNDAPCPGLTQKIVLEILEHEAIVPEAYRDSQKIWTWGVGVTSRSGHDVDRYIDNPQEIKRCLEIYIWLLNQNYLPAVIEAFRNRPLNEHQLGAALSFHYNTGSIHKATWVTEFCAGEDEKSRASFMNWCKPKEIIPRRKKECALFFDGIWTSDGLVTVYDVAKPTYTPKWSSTRQVDVRADNSG